MKFGGAVFLVSKAHKKENPTRNGKIKHYKTLKYNCHVSSKLVIEMSDLYESEQ